MPERQPQMEEPGMEAYGLSTHGGRIQYLIEWITLDRSVTSQLTQEQRLEAAARTTCESFPGSVRSQNSLAKLDGHDTLSFKMVEASGALHRTRIFFHKDASLIFTVRFEQFEVPEETKRFMESIHLK